MNPPHKFAIPKVRLLRPLKGNIVDYYNHERYHESLDNLTPADVYFGRGQGILERRARIKQKTMGMRRRLHQKLAA